MIIEFFNNLTFERIEVFLVRVAILILVVITLYQFIKFKLRDQHRRPPRSASPKRSHASNKNLPLPPKYYRN
jgi:hypothetical protein